MTTAPSAKKHILATIVALIIAGWLLIALVDDNGITDWTEAVVMGVLFGTIFGQVSLAATWCALGPFSLASRLPLSAGWLAALVLAVGCLISRDGPGGGALIVTLVFGAAFLGQWVLVQVPMWLTVILLGLCIRHSTEMHRESNLKGQQFGIRQLMVLTVIVGVVMGIGRLLFGGVSEETVMGDWSGMMGVFAAASFHALIAFPLVAAALLRSKVAIGVCAALLLVGMATFLEVPLLRIAQGARGSPPHEYLMVWIMSATQSLWILGVVFLLRMAGYGLISRAKVATVASGSL